MRRPRGGPWVLNGHGGQEYLGGLEAQEASRDEEETKEQHDDEVEAASSELQSGIDCECDPVCWGHMHPTIVVRD